MRPGYMNPAGSTMSFMNGYAAGYIHALRRAGSEDRNSLPEAEEWRALEGFDLAYEVSSLGRVRTPRLRGHHILSPGFTHDGYAYVMLKQDGRTRINYVHRLVCEAWHGPRSYDTMQAAHLDGYQGNNRPSNLAWASPSENNLHKHQHGTAQRGHRGSGAKLTEESVRQAVEWVRQGMTHREAGERLGVSRKSIGDIMAGTQWGWLTGIERKKA